MDDQRILDLLGRLLPSPTPSERDLDVYGLQAALTDGADRDARARAQQATDPRWKQAARSALENVFDFAGGAMGMSSGDSKASLLGELLAAAVPVAAPLGSVKGALRDLIRIKNPIKAYHGSPHDFDAFELSKIGTGEGAQSYGHGLYFAERPENAEFYRSAVSAAHAAGMKGGVRPLGSTTRQELALMQQLRDGYHAATQQHAPFAVFRDLPSFYNARQRFLSGEMGEVAQRGYREAEARLRASRLGGHLYEVNLHASPDEFLDWDARLSQQGEKVRQSVSRIDAEALKDPPTLSQIPDLAIRDVIRQALKQNEGRARDLELVIDNDGRLYQSIVDHAKRKGVDLATNDMRASDYVYQRASQFLDQLHASQEHTGEALHRMLGSKGNDMIGQAHVASRLREAGIPGIKYLDQGSRAAGEGTRNYVVFDDRLIEIVKKYGIAGAVSAGLLSEAQARQLAAQGGAPTGTR